MAFEGLGGNPTSGFGAANFAALSFANWETALGGQGVLQENILSRAGVVHLIAEDTYLDIRFTQWASQSGAVVYRRAAVPTSAPAVPAIPLPAHGLGLGLGLISLGAVALRRQWLGRRGAGARAERRA